MIWRMILALLAVGAGLDTAVAQPLPNSRADLPFSYAPVVKRVSPAVVNIYTATKRGCSGAIRSRSPACRKAATCRTRWAPVSSCVPTA